MRVPTQFAIACAVAALGAQTAFAIDSTGSSQRSEPKSVTAASPSSKHTGDVRASKLIGATLKTSDGQELGQIQDLVVNPQTGKISFAIVGVDAGGAEALAPIPWQALNLESEKSYSASIDKQKLKTAPRMSQSQWDQLTEPDYVVRIYKFYGYPPENGMGGSEQVPGETQSGSDQSSGSSASDQSSEKSTSDQGSDQSSGSNSSGQNPEHSSQPQ